MNAAIAIGNTLGFVVREDEVPFGAELASENKQKVSEALNPDKIYSPTSQTMLELALKYDSDLAIERNLDGELELDLDANFSGVGLSAFKRADVVK
jgi:hypothetical protein